MLTLNDNLYNFNMNTKILIVLKMLFLILSTILYLMLAFGGDYTILVCQDEISTRPAGTDFTLRLYVEIKFRPCKAGQFSTWHLLRFVWNFLELFFPSMPVYEIENQQISIDFNFFCLSGLVFSCVYSFS